MSSSPALARFRRTALLGLGLALAGLLPPGSAAAAEPFEGHVHYFGDLHAHTGYSLDGASSDLGNCDAGGCGDAADFFNIARDEAGLDFCAISDHVNGERSMDSSSWPLVVQLVNEANDPEGGFVSILGAELDIETAGGERLGHRNLLFFSGAEALSAIPFEDAAAPGSPADCAGIWQILAELEALHGPLLYIPHHPIADMPAPTDWSCQDPVYSPVVEIYSAHGNSHAHPSVDDYDPVWSESVEGSSVAAALDPASHGHRVGIVGGTDFHDTQPGRICHLDARIPYMPYGGSLTGLFLDADVPLDRAAIHEALTARHSYATTGPRVPTLLELLDADGESLGVMGDILPSIDSLPVTLQLRVPEAFGPHVTAVELLDGSGGAAAMEETAPGTFSLELVEASFPWLGYAAVQVDGASYWAAQGTPCTDHSSEALGQDDSERIWTSPLWIGALVPGGSSDTEPQGEGAGLGRANSDGCACGARSSGVSGAGFLLLLVAARLGRIRRSTDRDGP